MQDLNTTQNARQTTDVPIRPNHNSCRLNDARLNKIHGKTLSELNVVRFFY